MPRGVSYLKSLHGNSRCLCVHIIRDGSPQHTTKPYFQQVAGAWDHAGRQLWNYTSVWMDLHDVWMCEPTLDQSYQMQLQVQEISTNYRILVTPFKKAYDLVHALTVCFANRAANDPTLIIIDRQQTWRRGIKFAGGGAHLTKTYGVTI